MENQKNVSIESAFDNNMSSFQKKYLEENDKTDLSPRLGTNES